MELFTSIQAFASTVISPLIKDSARFAAMCMSYHELPIPNGVVRSEDGTLTIVVESEELQFDRGRLVELLAHHKDADLLSAIVGQIKRQAISTQQSLALKILVQIREIRDDPILIVAYGGSNAFSETLNGLVKFKLAREPAPHVALLTCNCEISRKQLQLHLIRARGDIDHVIFVEECGGVASMIRIVKHLTEEWSQKTAHSI